LVFGKEDWQGINMTRAKKKTVIVLYLIYCPYSG